MTIVEPISGVFPLNARSDFFKLVDQGGGRYVLSGELSFASVDLALKATSGLPAAGVDQLQFDLSGITRADSAGLAILLEWLRKAADRGVKLSYVKPPQQLLDIARVAGLHEILPFS